MEVLSSVRHTVLPAAGSETHGRGELVVVADNATRVAALGGGCAAAPYARSAGALAKRQARACP